MSSLSHFIWKLVSARPQFPTFQALEKAHSLKQVIKTTTMNSPIAVNQRDTIEQRSQILRQPVQKSKYFHFLRRLYPDMPYVHFASLLEAYKELPSPQPLCIDHYHFEHMLAQFLKVSASDSTKEISKFFNCVLYDMKKSGMKVSWKEENAALFMSFNGFKRPEWIVNEYNRLMKSRLKNGGKVDISTMNMFLRYAVLENHHELMQRINEDIINHKIKTNRVSFELLMRICLRSNDPEGLEASLMAMIDSGLTIDIFMVNNCIKLLVENGELEMAEKIISQLGTYAKDHSDSLRLDSKQSKRAAINILNALDSLELQTMDCLLFPIVPIFETYKPIFNHYLQLKNFNPDKLLTILQTLQSQSIAIPNFIFLEIFKVLESHELENSRLVDFLRIYRSQMHKSVKYDHNMLELILAAHMKQNGSVSSEIRTQSQELNYLYRKVEAKSNMRPWSVVDINPFIADIIDDLVIA